MIGIAISVESAFVNPKIAKATVNDEKIIVTTKSKSKRLYIIINALISYFY